MNLRDRVEFLKTVNRELSKYRAFRVGVAALVLSALGLALAYVAYSVYAVALTIVALAVAITEFVSASVQARREVAGRATFANAS